MCALGSIFVGLPVVVFEHGLSGHELEGVPFGDGIGFRPGGRPVFALPEGGGGRFGVVTKKGPTWLMVDDPLVWGKMTHLLWVPLTPEVDWSRLLDGSGIGTLEGKPPQLEHLRGFLFWA